MEHLAEHPPKGPTAAAISDALVQLFRIHLGKGPEKAKTYLHEDLVVCLLEGGFTRAEETLREAGRGDIVRESRGALQHALEREMRASVERITGRDVIAFMSASSLAPQLSIESFVLAPRYPEPEPADPGI